MGDKTELQKIREMFKVSRKVFGEVFLCGVSLPMMCLYETRKNPIPRKILALARYWKARYIEINGGEDDSGIE